MNKRQIKLQAIKDWNINKPITNSQWAEDTKKESLHVKRNDQLSEMKESHEAKVIKVKKDVNKFLNYPEAVKFELDEQFTQIFEEHGNSNKIEGKTKQQCIDGEFVEQDIMYKWKIAKLHQSVERINKEIELRTTGFLSVLEKIKGDKRFEPGTKEFKGITKVGSKVRAPVGTTYYIDADNGAANNSGLTAVQSSAVNISATTASNDQVTTSAAHGLITGDQVVIAGNTGTTPDINGANQTITVVDTTNFIIDGVDITVDGNADGTVQEEDGPYVDLDNFASTSRSAGDVAICRNGMTNNYDDGTDLLFTSDGSLINPITIEADYANAFSDDVDLSVTGTATLTFGSKTVTFSSDISSVCAVGDFIYASGDDAKVYAYEVAAVSTVTVTLYLPYKGDQAGAGKTMTNIQNPPRWGTTAANFQCNLDGDHYWRFQGIHFRGTDSSGQMEVDSCEGHLFMDCIFQGNGASDWGFFMADDSTSIIMRKCRIFDNNSGAFRTIADAHGRIKIYDSIIRDGGYGLDNSNGDIDWELYECELNNTTDIRGNPREGRHTKLRNTLMNGTTPIGSMTFTHMATLSFEDYDGVLNDNRFHYGQIANINSVLYQSETTKVRSGGSNASIKVTPTTKMGTNWEHTHLKLLDIPIYATTDSKTYTVYFASADNTDWDSDPTAGELWIELEAWGHASNNFRKITKSTGAVDFSTDTDFDQSLAVTVAPAQAGVAYLRVWYAKTKEATNANLFYVDPIPTIT